MIKGTISWHSAPEFSHKGYIYRPEVDEDDEGIRKATHYCINRVDRTDVMIAPHLPYHFLTEVQFKDFINQMLKVRSMS